MPRRQLSKNQINKAGRTLRRYFSNAEPRPTGAEARSAFAVLRDYRSSHNAALPSARMGLLSCIRTEGVLDIILAQRLKRIPTIIDKLRREPTMALTTMADIAGCRAVFLTHEELDRHPDPLSVVVNLPQYAARTHRSKWL